MDGIAYLIKETNQRNDVGQFIPAEEKTQIFVSVENVSRNEWVSAGKNGLASELMMTTAFINYSGQKLIEYDGVRYAIYRTYITSDGDDIELYLSRKVGV